MRRPGGVFGHSWAAGGACQEGDDTGLPPSLWATVSAARRMQPVAKRTYTHGCGLLAACYHRTSCRVLVHCRLNSAEGTDEAVTQVRLSQ